MSKSTATQNENGTSIVTDDLSDLERPNKLRDDRLRNDAVGYNEYRKGLDTNFTKKEQTRVLWKIDLIVLPIFFITQCLQFMDRTALNYANLFGYQKALKLKGSQFNYLSAMVYAGYFFGQYPCGWLIGRYRAQRVLGITCLFWGMTVVIMTRCHNYKSALATRFFLGMFEAAVTPGQTLMTGFFYKRSEIPLRQCIWYSSLGFGGIIGSYISNGVASLSDDVSPQKWQIIFYVLGGATMVWSFVIFFVLPDNPANAAFLNERERLVAVWRTAGNEMGIKNKEYKPKQALLTLYDPKAILIFISVFAAAIPNGVVQSFSTIIIRDLGFSTQKTTQLKSVGDAIQIIALIVGGAITFTFKDSRLLTATAANLLCTVAAACMAYLPRSNTWGRLVSFWLVNAQSVGFTISLVTISSNMGGYTHRSIASALFFTAYCWGNFAGPFVVKQSESPNFPTATAGLLAGYSIKMGCHLILLGYLYYINRSRNRKYGPANTEASKEAGMQDQTEFENKNFRYVL